MAKAAEQAEQGLLGRAAPQERQVHRASAARVTASEELHGSGTPSGSGGASRTDTTAWEEQ